MIHSIILSEVPNKNSKCQEIFNHYLSAEQLLTRYMAQIRLEEEYSSHIYNSVPKYCLWLLDSIQRTAVKWIDTNYISNLFLSTIDVLLSLDFFNFFDNQDTIFFPEYCIPFKLISSVLD